MQRGWMMAEAFDPYRKWLGIPPAEQPPNHYRLLGIGVFEDDPDVISSAADRQMAHVRSFQTGRHSELSQRILNELSAARLCLLKPEEKAAYDQKLRSKAVLPAPPAVVSAAPQPVDLPRAAPLPVARPLPSDDRAMFEPSTDVPEIRRRLPRPKPAWQQPAVLATAAVVAVVLVAGAVFWANATRDAPPKQSVAVKKTAEPVVTAPRPQPAATDKPKPTEYVAPAANVKPDIRKPSDKPVDKAPPPEIPQPPPASDKPHVPNEKPSEKSSAGTAAAAPRREGRTVDLLKLIDTKRDVLSGSWKFDSEALVITDGQTSRLQLPLPAPDEYRITLTVEGQPALGEVHLGIMIGEAPTMVILDGWDKGSSSLLWLDGVVPNQSTRGGRTLADGRPNTIECEVRRDGVRVTCGEKTAIDWKGDWRRVSQPEDWQRGGRRRLCLGATGAACRITRLELTELLADGGAAAASTGSRGAIDLLKLVDTSRDTQRGQWRLEGGKLIGERRSLLMIPQELPDEYALSLDVRRIEGNDTLGVTLVVGSGRTTAVIDGWGSTSSGLHALDGREANNNETTRRGAVLREGQTNSIECVVRNGVLVTCNGEKIIDWTGDPKRLSIVPGYAGERPERLYLDTAEASYEFTRLELVPLTSLKSDSSPPAAIDLLKRIDVKRDAVAGDWKLDDGALTPPPDENARLQLPVMPPDEYQLTCVFSRGTPPSEFTLGLVVGGHQTLVVLEGWGNLISGLDLADGRQGNDNATTHRGRVLDDERPNTLVCTVRKAQVRVECNGQTIIDWHGKPESLSLRPEFAVTDPKSLFLRGRNARFRITRLELVPLSSDAPRTTLAELVNDEPSDEPATKEENRPKKPSPPTGDSLAAAEQKVLGIYAGDLKDAITPAGRQKIFEKMYDRASAGDDDDHVRYVLCRQASVLAMERGNAASAARAWEVAARLFDVDLWQTKAKLLEQALRSNPASDEAWCNLLMALSLADGAILDERFALAKDFIAAAQTMARRIKSRTLQNEASRRRAALRARETRLQKYKDALAALKRQGDDAAMHLAAGRYEALVRGGWTSARAHLAKAADADLAALMALEKLAQSDPTRRLEAAETWLAAAEKADETWQADYRQQAKYWLVRATGLLGELDRPRAEKLLTELADIPVPLARLRPGLAAQYFDGGDFQSLRLERIDRQIDWYFGARSPGPGLPGNFYSIRWTGWLLPPVSGKYRIVTKTDDGVRLWIDNKQLMDFWNQVAEKKAVEIELTATPHSVQMEYFEAFPQAVAELRWALIEGGAHGEQPIPAEALYHDPHARYERAGPLADNEPKPKR